MRILYVGMRYDYGDPRLGDCFEYRNFHDTLRRMPGITVEHFPYDVILRAEGRSRMNEQLRRTAERAPDLYFFVLYTDEIAQETIAWLTNRSGAVTLNWFGDDHWRFEGYSRFWAPLFTWTVTTDPRAAEQYRKAGMTGVVRSQWGFNHHGADDRPMSEGIDVSFVGRAHSQRRKIVQTLRRAGINVAVWGPGWENGPLSGESMVENFRRSRINLNFTESSASPGIRSAAKSFLSRRADGSYVVRPIREIVPSLRGVFAPRITQIKGRNFEIPGHGGFLLTSDAEELDRYFVPGKEIAVWKDTDDLVDKIRHYLAHDAERRRIREAGRRRTLAEHTYERRFHELFRAIGLTHG